jgi:plasmid stabilization system protein ParE
LRPSGYTLRFSAESIRDIENAVYYYNIERAGLGEEFRAELAAKIDSISANPHAFQVIYKDGRRACLSRFPYGVFFRERKNLIRIVAVIHLHRDPRTWQRRI